MKETVRLLEPRQMDTEPFSFQDPFLRTECQRFSSRSGTHMGETYIWVLSLIMILIKAVNSRTRTSDGGSMSENGRDELMTAMELSWEMLSAEMEALLKSLLTEEMETLRSEESQMLQIGRRRVQFTLMTLSKEVLFGLLYP